MLFEAPILELYDVNKDAISYYDASDYCFGWVVD